MSNWFDDNAHPSWRPFGGTLGSIGQRQPQMGRMPYPPPDRWPDGRSRGVFVPGGGIGMPLNPYQHGGPEQPSRGILDAPPPAPEPWNPWGGTPDPPPGSFPGVPIYDDGGQPVGVGMPPRPIGDPYLGPPTDPNMGGGPVDYNPAPQPRPPGPPTDPITPQMPVPGPWGPPDPKMTYLGGPPNPPDMPRWGPKQLPPLPSPAPRRGGLWDPPEDPSPGLGPLQHGTSTPYTGPAMTTNRRGLGGLGGNMVTMQGPTGQQSQVHESHVPHFTAQGAMVVG